LKQETDFYIGLMSGTSMDAIDAALVDFAPGTPRLVAAINHPLPETLHAELSALCQSGADEIERLGRADVALGEVFAAAALRLLEQANVPAREIRAIGSHGQTVRHRPEARFTLQIGDPNVIAERTGITTVADFRRRDLAAGGVGAPLVPAFHAAVLHQAGRKTVVVNIGGIANVTVLNTEVTGFDTGPGNGLMDAWARQHLGRPLDEGGAWAASGRIDQKLLAQLLAHEFFRRPPPKSTGRETFHAAWLAQQLAASRRSLSPQDVQATLCELTVVSIAEAIRTYASSSEEVLVCGGGVHNTNLMARLREHLQPTPVLATGERGVPADWMEAMAFAWLARETLAHRPGNLPSVTGASRPVILGGVYYGR
jgi:anhydro-N-acetylmuramic acid kinase